MSFPSTIDVIPTFAGTSLMGDVDHAGVLHGGLNTLVLAIENTIGTTAGTSILKNFTAGQFAAKDSGGTFTNTTISSGTINNVTMGTPIITTPTLNGVSLIGTVSTLNGTETLINKRFTKRVYGTTVAGTITPDVSLYDAYEVTSQTVPLTWNTPTGTPTNEQALVIRMKDGGTAVAYTLGTAYRFSTDLPKGTATIASKTVYYGFLYNSADSIWDCLAIQNNF